MQTSEMPVCDNAYNTGVIFLFFFLIFLSFLSFWKALASPWQKKWLVLWCSTCSYEIIKLIFILQIAQFSNVQRKEGDRELF